MSPWDFAERQLAIAEHTFPGGEMIDVVEAVRHAVAACAALPGADAWIELVEAERARDRLADTLDMVLLDDDIAARRLDAFIAVTGALRRRVIEAVDTHAVIADLERAMT